MFCRRVQVSMIATDVYRPAAIDQLVTLGQRVGVPVFEMGTDARPADIAKAGLQQARKVRRPGIEHNKCSKVASQPCARMLAGTFAFPPN